MLGKWPETLWKKYKVTHEVYEDLLYKSRDGVVSRKRNLEACRQREEQQAARQALEERVKRIRGNPELFKPFPEVPEAKAWLNVFNQDAVRYPILIVLGPSRSGKTEWAKSLFQRPLELKVGSLDHFPDRLREFRRGWHDALVLDDVRDMAWVVRHQEKLQGKYDVELEFGSTPGGHLAYSLDLFALPVVVTVNYSTANLGLLLTDDFLSNPGNRVLVKFERPLF